jgi:hypothetical protein
MAKPLGQSIPQSSYQQPGVSGKNNSALGTLLLVIGVILFIVWLVIKTTQLLNWYEGWIPFIWAEYFKDGWLTFVSFVSPFLLWGAGLLALSGLGSVLQNKK